MLTKGIIDRFEGNLAVIEVEDRNLINIEKKLLPQDAKEGDCVTIVTSIDKDKTKERKDRINSLMQKLQNK